MSRFDKKNSTAADYEKMGKDAQSYTNETQKKNKHNQNSNSNQTSGAQSAKDLEAFRKQFGLHDAGLPDIKKKGGKFNTTDIYGETLSRKDAKKTKGDPYAGVYNDADSGAIYDTDGTYLGSISQKAGAKSQAINDHWVSMGTDHKGEATAAFGSGDEGNELNSHHNIAQAVRNAYQDQSSKEDLPSFNEATFSPQVQEAIDRANSYRERRLNGQQSQDIFGHWGRPSDGKGQDVSNVDSTESQMTGADRAVDGAAYGKIKGDGNLVLNSNDSAYFDSEKYALDLKNKRARSEAAQA